MSNESGAIWGDMFFSHQQQPEASSSKHGYCMCQRDKLHMLDHVQSWMIQSLVPFPTRSDVGNPIRSHVTGGPLGRLLGPIALSVAKPWENRWPEDSNSAKTHRTQNRPWQKKRWEHHDLKQLEVIFPMSSLLPLALGVFCFRQAQLQNRVRLLQF